METLSQIAKRLNVSIYAVQRAVKARDVRPAAVYGNVGVYDAAGAREIEEQINAVRSRRVQPQLATA